MKFLHKDPFLGKFEPKKSKLYFLPENWHTWHLGEADSYAYADSYSYKLSGFLTINPFLEKLGQASQNCPLCQENDTKSSSKKLILIPTLVL